MSLVESIGSEPGAEWPGEDLGVQPSRRFGLLPPARVAVPYGVLAALVIVMVFRQPGFVSLSQFDTLTGNALPLILVAAGQTVVILAGGIDLSVGGIISIVTVLAATHMHSSIGSMVATTVLLGLGGLLAGVLNGVLVAFVRIQPLIATLATWSIWGGLALVILPSPGGNVPPRWASLTTGSLIGIPSEIWFLGAIVLVWCLFLRTRTALAVRAVGSSLNDAFLAGLSVRPTLIKAYALSGLAAAATGLYLVSSTVSGSPTIGTDYILPSIAAVGIGGARLSGGSARLSGAIAGAYILTVVNDVAFTLGLPSGWATFVVGPLLILAVLAGSLVGVGRLRVRRS